MRPDSLHFSDTRGDEKEQARDEKGATSEVREEPGEYIVRETK